MNLRAHLTPADLLAGGLATAVGTFFFWGSFQINVREGVIGGPQVVPRAASLCLMAAGIGILVAAMLPGRLSRSDQPTPLVFLIVGVGIAYVWLIEAVGYLPATLAAASLAFAAFGGRGLRGAVLPGIAATLAIYLIFFMGLGIYDPPGRLLDFRGLVGL